MPYFFRLKKLIHELIFVKNVFELASTKNYNVAVAMRKNCATQTKPTTPSVKKDDIWEVEDFLDCAPMILFFYFDEIKGVLHYTKRDL